VAPVRAGLPARGDPRPGAASSASASTRTALAGWPPGFEAGPRLGVTDVEEAVAVLRALWARRRRPGAGAAHQAGVAPPTLSGDHSQAKR
jgi:hypothetical protein